MRIASNSSADILIYLLYYTVFFILKSFNVLLCAPFIFVSRNNFFMQTLFCLLGFLVPDTVAIEAVDDKIISFNIFSSARNMFAILKTKFLLSSLALWIYITGT